MKVIDLLNKIANGEEVPEYVKYKNHHSLDTEDTMLVCKENLFFKLDQLEIYLNDEVKPIEEDKEIEELTVCGKNITTGAMLEWIGSDCLNKQIEKLCSGIEVNAIMINKLIRTINELKKGK